MTAAKYYGVALFQFTPLREGRLGATSGGSKFSINFNSRPSARGDAELLGRHYIGIISIHAPPRGATPVPRVQSANTSNFNSRPSARGDTSYRPEQRLYIISIHAPPRGATLTIDYVSGIIPISIHAPPRGATGGIPTALVTDKFQFTPLREGRRPQIISVEADKTFQFTPLREGRRGDVVGAKTATTFQFTPLREGRQFSITCLLACGYFNSRPSARGDKLHGNVVTNIKQFQFTPLREGRRVRKIKTIDDPDISIHAPPRGAT